MTGRRRATCVVALLVTALGSVPPSSAEAPVVHRGVARSFGGASPAEVGRMTLFDLRHGAMEPTLGLTPDGDIFVAAATANTRAEVLRSRDSARTWEKVSPTLPNGENRHLVSLDPYVHVDQDTGRVFTIDLTAACSYMSFSDDLGETWRTNPLACGTPVNDHQTLFTGPPVSSTPALYENLVYYCSNQVVGAVCAKSLDGGLTFTATGEPAIHAPAASPTDAVEGCGVVHGHGVVAPNGDVYLPTDYCGTPSLVISEDEGRTWERVAVAGIGTHGGSDPSVAVDPAGNLFYLWIAPDRLPRLVVSRDRGRNWSKPTVVAPRGLREANLPSLAAGRPGELAILFVGSENSRFSTDSCADPTDPLTCRSSYADVAWNGYVAKTGDALRRRPVFLGGRVNPADRPLVYGRCGPGRCSVMLDFLDVEIDERGSVWGVFVGEGGYWGENEYDTRGLVARLDPKG